MNEIIDTLGIINLDTWNATDINIISYLKTPIQHTFFSNNAHLIGKTLRQAIIYFSDTLNSIDRMFCSIGNEFRSTRTRKYSIIQSETTTIIEITTLAPIAFEDLRSMIGITRQDFHSSFYDGELIDFINTGKSGSQMYKTSDEIYILKTLRDHEAKLLIQILSGLYLHYSHSSTLITRYVGLYSINISSIISSEIYCVLMLNSLPSILNIDEIYDLKGSTIGRLSHIDFPLRRLKALKDLDFQSFYPHGIRLPYEIHRQLKHTIECDLFQLKKLHITDFSLILGIHHLDNEQNSLKPQLGISSLFLTTTNLPSNKHHSSIKTKTFILKPLQLIDYHQNLTFEENTCLGIPGVTHDGHRVLLYPALIDCLQTYDHFKHIQHLIQNFRDPKRKTDYSVIHPDEYEKRLFNFLFEKIFIDSKQTLNELVQSDEILIERTSL